MMKRWTHLKSCSEGHSSMNIFQGQRSTPFTSADSSVMVNSLSVCRMRESECTAARSFISAPSSYVRAVRGNAANRGSHWERSRSLLKGTGLWLILCKRKCLVGADIGLKVVSLQRTDIFSLLRLSTRNKDSRTLALSMFGNVWLNLHLAGLEVILLMFFALLEIKKRSTH